MPTITLKLISINDAAAYVGLDARTIRRYIAAGRLRAYRVGDRLIKVDQADVDKLIRPVTIAGR